MVKLRDFFERDFATFFNTDEFAEIHIVDGKNIPIVIDDDLLQEKKLRHGGEGLFRGEVLFHVSVSDLEKKPLVDRVMKFNNKIYTIGEVSETEGMYTIMLERNRS